MFQEHKIRMAQQFAYFLITDSSCFVMLQIKQPYKAMQYVLKRCQKLWLFCDI